MIQILSAIGAIIVIIAMGIANLASERKMLWTALRGIGAAIYVTIALAYYDNLWMGLMEGIVMFFSVGGFLQEVTKQKKLEHIADFFCPTCARDYQCNS